MDKPLVFFAAVSDIVKYGQKAIDDTDALSFEEYLSDWDVQLKVERCLLVVGEAAGRIRNAGLAAELPEIHKIIGFRNLLAHEYDALNQPNVWGILRIHLPALVQHARQILDSTDDKGHTHFIL